MTDDKQVGVTDLVRPAALYSPPSHPTTLGNVWAGMICPNAVTLAQALTAENVAQGKLKKSGDR